MRHYLTEDKIMKVYRLANIPTEYQAFELDVVTLSEQVGRSEIINKMMMPQYSFGPLLPYWGMVYHHFSPNFSSALMKPDICLWDSRLLLMNQDAYLGLRHYLARFGEFLPLRCDGGIYYVFNCLTVADEDRALTKVRYFDGHEDGLDSLSFDQDSLTNKLLFRSQMQGGTSLFCTQTFVDLVREFQFVGLAFDEALVSEACPS
ncbi:hypothetical protein GT360_08350 [Vibrio astriarenae]|uniref:Uncharacterized protein n=1 Tax=Vibrio astriarenae TaxID=1481923 RepID=A0A7Z2YDU2_9VIBR|nr:hypothetical protein [Vibrio astriarenae]QIA63529.1 hypothetical protein GT360_08350 [Vibrio astriarenae]